MHQAIAEDAQNMPVLQIHFGEIAKNARAEFGITVVDKHVGHIEKEGSAVGVTRLLIEIDAITLSGGGLANACDIGGIGLPLLQADRGVGGAASRADRGARW